MKIVLIPHLKIRLKERKIPQNYPRKVLENPQQKFKDTLTGHRIAVRQLEYGKKL